MLHLTTAPRPIDLAIVVVERHFGLNRAELIAPGAGCDWWGSCARGVLVYLAVADLQMSRSAVAAALGWPKTNVKRHFRRIADLRGRSDIFRAMLATVSQRLIARLRPAGIGRAA